MECKDLCSPADTPHQFPCPSIKQGWQGQRGGEGRRREERGGDERIGEEVSGEERRGRARRERERKGEGRRWEERKGEERRMCFSVLSYYSPAMKMV